MATPRKCEVGADGRRPWETPPHPVAGPALLMLAVMVLLALPGGLSAGAQEPDSTARGDPVPSDRADGPVVFMWTGSHHLIEQEPRMFRDILRFAERHGIVPYESGADRPEVARRFLDACRELGIEDVWLEIGPKRRETEGATAREFATDSSRRAATLERFREIARILRERYPDGARITLFDEAPLGPFASEPGGGRASYVEAVRQFREWGPRAFAQMSRTLKAVHPEVRVGVFLHHPHNASPAMAGRWSFIGEFMEETAELGMPPDFIYSDVYRGYFNRGFGVEATDAYITDVAAHIDSVGARHGVPAYQLGQAHTIKLGYTPSRWEIDRNVEAMLAGGLDGIGWYWPNYAATDHVDPTVPAGYQVSFDSFVPNAWGEVGPAGSLYGTSRDRFVYAYLRALEAAGRLEPEDRFDLWVYGRDFDHGEHGLHLKANPGEGGEWELVGHFDGDQDSTAYVSGARPEYVRDRDGEWEAAVFHGLSRARYLGQDFRESSIQVRIATDSAADGSELAAIYAMPYRPTRNYRTEEEIAGLVEENPRWIRVNSLASHVRPRPARLVPGTVWTEKLEAPIRKARPGVLEVEWLDFLWRTPGGP